jgi:hypothetical protein
MVRKTVRYTRIQLYHIYLNMPACPLYLFNYVTRSSESIKLFSTLEHVLKLSYIAGIMKQSMQSICCQLLIDPTRWGS